MQLDVARAYAKSPVIIGRKPRSDPRQRQTHELLAPENGFYSSKYWNCDCFLHPSIWYQPRPSPLQTTVAASRWRIKLFRGLAPFRTADYLDLNYAQNHSILRNNRLRTVPFYAQKVGPRREMKCRDRLFLLAH